MRERRCENLMKIQKKIKSFVKYLVIPCLMAVVYFYIAQPSEKELSLIGNNEEVLLHSSDNTPNLMPLALQDTDASLTNPIEIKFYDKLNPNGLIKYIESNETFSLPTLDKVGEWTFVGWKADSALNENLIITGDQSTGVTKSYYAIYSRNITVSYSKEFRSLQSPLLNETVTVSTSTTIKQLSNAFGDVTQHSFTLDLGPTNQGYIFKEWRLNGYEGQAFAGGSAVNISQNATFYPIYDEIRYQINYYNGTSIGETKTYNYNSSFSLRIPSNMPEGYGLYGYTTDKNSLTADSNWGYYRANDEVNVYTKVTATNNEVIDLYPVLYKLVWLTYDTATNSQNFLYTTVETTQSTSLSDQTKTQCFRFYSMYKNEYQNPSVTGSTDTPTKIGWEFVGWNTDKDAKVGQNISKVYSESDSTSYYAIYKFKVTLNVYNIDINGSQFLVKHEEYVYNNGTSYLFELNGETYDGWTFAGYRSDIKATNATITNSNGKYKVLVGINDATSPDGIGANKGTIYICAIYTRNIAFTIDGGTITGSVPSQIQYLTAYETVQTEHKFMLEESLNPLKEGYTFDGFWCSAKDSNGVLSGDKYYSGQTYTLTESITIYTSFSVNHYTVYIKNGTDIIKTIKMEYGKKQVIGASGITPPTGYTLFGFTDIATTNTFDKTFDTNTEIFNWSSSKDGEIYIYAIWQKTFEITYDVTTNGGSINPAITKGFGTQYFNPSHTGTSKYSNPTITITSEVPSKTGWKFIGWDKVSSSLIAEYSSNSSIILTESIVLYALYDKIVTAYFKDGSSNKIITHTLNNAQSNIKITLPTILTKTGWIIAGWRADTTATAQEYLVNADYSLADNVTFYAIWKKDITLSYDVTSNGGSGSVASTIMTAYCNYNDGITDNTTYPDITITSIIPVKTGYQFVGWNKDEANSSTVLGSNELFFEDLAVDKTIYGVFKKDFKVKFIDNVGSTDLIVSIYNNETSVNKTHNIVINEKDGWITRGWTILTTANPDSYFDPSQEFAVSSDMKVYAIYSKVISITYDINGGTSGSANTEGTVFYSTYNNGTTEGASIIFSNTIGVHAGWDFIGYGSEITSHEAIYDAGETVVLTEDLTVYAIFKKTFAANLMDKSGTKQLSGGAYLSDNDITKIKFLLPALTSIPYFQSLGWTTSSSSTDIEYSADYIFECSIEGYETVTFYALYGRTVTISFVTQGIALDNLESYQACNIMNQSSFGKAKFTLPNSATRTYYDFEVWALGSENGDKVAGGSEIELEESITVYAIWVALPYFINDLTDITIATFDTTYSYVGLNVRANIGDGKTILYGAANLPKGLSIDSQTGNITGIPEVVSADGFTFTITATASNGRTTSKEINIVIVKKNVSVNFSNTTLTYNEGSQTPTAKIVVLGVEYTLSFDKGITNVSQNGTTLTASLKSADANKLKNLINIVDNTVIPTMLRADITDISTQTINVGDAKSFEVLGLRDNDIVTYSTAYNGYYTEVAPLLYQVGAYTLWYKIVRNDNYNDLVEIAYIVIPNSNDTFSLNGVVVDSNKKPVKDVTIVVKSGAKVFFTTTSGNNGEFLVYDLPMGNYNIYAIVDLQIMCQSFNLFEDISGYILTLSKYNLLTKVEVDQSIGRIVVDNLNKLFTQEDLNNALGNNHVELEVIVTDINGSIEVSLFDILKKKNVCSTFDISIFKTTSSTGKKENLTKVDDLISISVPLSEKQMNKYRYELIRIHNGEIQVLTTQVNQDGEYIELSSDGKSIVLHVKNFSQYSVVHYDAPCYLHFAILGILVLFVTFFVIWVVVFKHHRFNMVSIIVTSCYALTLFVLNFFVYCGGCEALIVLSWLSLILASVYWLLDEKDKEKVVNVLRKNKSNKQKEMKA